MDLRIILLALCVLVVVYAYVLYPLTLMLLRSVAPYSRVADSEPPPLPRVSITLPAYNAEATIRPVLDALVALDYPEHLRQILVVSDGSTDATDSIVKEYADRGVELLRVEGRRGKTEIENQAHEHLRGDIVINTDASVMLHRASVLLLVRAMEDPSVGVASGYDVSIESVGAPRDSSEAAYVSYEMRVRALESETGGIVGASGCLYAIRAALHRRVLPPHLSRDFSSALWARLQGFRAISVPGALCFVPRASGMRIEYRRKVRTMSRGLQTLFYHRQLLKPWTYGLFAYKLWSHKLVRWMVPFAIAIGGGVVLSLGGWLLILAGLVPAAAGWWWPRGREVPWLPAGAGYFVSGVFAGLVAWQRAVFGAGAPLWEPTPRAVATSAAPRATS
jgi:cellulose synthase/poly-beta-1,6-N-acetylglucosamine synthase-like glycosyltransferase